jgi:hypothetical protein
MQSPAATLMPDQLTIDIFGILHRTAEGRLAIAALVFIALVVTKRLWWPRNDQ